MNTQNIAFIMTGYFPLPPVKGGAVENLLYTLIMENEKRKKFNFTVFSNYDNNAEIQAKQLQYTDIIFIKVPCIVKIIDKIVYWIATYILKKSKKVCKEYDQDQLGKLGWLKPHKSKIQPALGSICLIPYKFYCKQQNNIHCV